MFFFPIYNYIWKDPVFVSCESSCLLPQIQCFVMKGCSHHFKGNRYLSVPIQLQMGTGNKHVPHISKHKKTYWESPDPITLFWQKIPNFKWWIDRAFWRWECWAYFKASLFLKVRDHQNGSRPLLTSKKKHTSLLILGWSTLTNFNGPAGIRGGGQAMCYRKEWPSILWLPLWPCPLILDDEWRGQYKG